MKKEENIPGSLFLAVFIMVLAGAAAAVSPGQGSTMKAIVFEEYGSPDVLKLKEIERPVPGEGEVLVQIQAASVNAADWRFLRGEPFLIRLIGGIFKPGEGMLGMDLAGRVEAVGQNASQFKPGDEVFGGSKFGSFAEYISVPENSLVLKPAGISFEQAATLSVAAITALQGLRDKGRIKEGQQVLVNGASGGVGTFALQIAKAYGAEVTAVCSTRNIDQARTLGADHVIDYKKEDFTKNGKKYDLILAVNGYHWILDYKRTLKPDGIYVAAGGTMRQVFQGLILGPVLSLFGDRKMKSLIVDAATKQKDLIYLSGLLESGKVVPVIDRRYSLREVPDAIRYLEEEHARGKVIIDIGSKPRYTTDNRQPFNQYHE